MALHQKTKEMLNAAELELRNLRTQQSSMESRHVLSSPSATRVRGWHKHRIVYLLCHRNRSPTSGIQTGVSVYYSWCGRKVSKCLSAPQWTVLKHDSNFRNQQCIPFILKVNTEANIKLHHWHLMRILPAFISDVLRSRQRRSTVPPATGRKSGRWPGREPQGCYFQNGAIQSYGSEPRRIPRQRKRGIETLAPCLYHLAILVTVADSFYKMVFCLTRLQSNYKHPSKLVRKKPKRVTKI